MVDDSVQHDAGDRPRLPPAGAAALARPAPRLARQGRGPGVAAPH